MSGWRLFLTGQASAALMSRCFCSSGEFLGMGYGLRRGGRCGRGCWSVMALVTVMFAPSNGDGVALGKSCPEW